MNIFVKNKVNDNNGRVLILEATIDGSDYLFTNLYNANTEREQLTTMKNLNNLLKYFFDIYHDENVIFAGDFNLIFNKNLESAGGIPLLKKHSLSEIIKLNKTFNLCDILRVRNRHKNYSLSNKNISLVLCDKDLITFSFLTVYKNQLKKQKF